LPAEKETKKLTAEQTIFCSIPFVFGMFLWRLKICNALSLSCGIKAGQNAIDSKQHRNMAKNNTKQTNKRQVVKECMSIFLVPGFLPLS